jgi:hypothetical protein
MRGSVELQFPLKRALLLSNQIHKIYTKPATHEMRISNGQINEIGSDEPRRDLMGCGVFRTRRTCWARLLNQQQLLLKCGILNKPRM